MNAADAPAWSDFLLRIERTRSPRGAWTVIHPVAGPQLYLPEREVLAATEEGREEVDIEIVSVGTERVMPRAQIFDTAGRQVGKSVSATPTSLVPGARERCRFRLTAKQRNALLEGGSLVLRPGSLPELYRTLRLRPHPLATTAVLEWPFPVPYFLRFEFGDEREGGASRATWAIGVEVETLSREPIAKTLLDPFPGEGGAVALLLPCVPIRYRFYRGGEVFRDPANPSWLSPPDDSWSLRAPRREWMLSNPSSFPLTGYLGTSPEEKVRIDPEFLDLAEGDRQLLRFTLESSRSEASSGRPEVVAVTFNESDNPSRGTLSEPVPFLKIALRPEPPHGAALRLVGGDLGVRKALRFDGGWVLDLPLDNPGTEPTRIALRLGKNGKRSPSIEIAPNIRLSALHDGGARFELPHELTHDLDEKGLLSAWIDAEQTLVWDPRLRNRRFEIEFATEGGARISPEEISQPGDLRWNAEKDTAILVVKNRAVCVTVQQVNVFRNGYPRDSVHPLQIVDPWDSVELLREPIAMRRWNRQLSLKAEALLVSGSFSCKRVAELTLRYHGGRWVKDERSG
jgi:hypothetical protein